LLNNNGTAGTNSGTPASFGAQGQILYDKIKRRPIVFMMVCGHIDDNGEGYRQDVNNGNTIKSYFFFTLDIRNPTRFSAAFRLSKLAGSTS